MREEKVLSDSEGEKMMGVSEWGFAVGHGIRVGEEKMVGKRDFGRGAR